MVRTFSSDPTLGGTARGEGGGAPPRPTERMFMHNVSAVYQQYVYIREHGINKYNMIYHILLKNVSRLTL